MKCRFGHHHPPGDVKLTARSSGHDGPIHCPDCHHTSNRRTDKRLWFVMRNHEKIKQSMNTAQLCQDCFPNAARASSEKDAVTHEELDA